MRALYDEERGRIFSVVHAEKLPYLVAEKSLDLLKYLSQGVKGICYYYNIVCINYPNIIVKLTPKIIDW